jgi:lipopolysaccharide biosynthesis glycosyltransferase
MRWYCTYCDRNYLVRLLALSDSLTRHERQPFTIFVVCLDELTSTMLNHLQVPNIRIIGLHELESGDRQLREARDTRSLVEYYWTLTPTVLLFLFEQYPQIDRLIYLDADLFFFSSPEPMFSEAPDASVLIHSHRFASKYKQLEAFGIYNVGLLSFVRNPESFYILNEWRGQCLNWCYASLEEGKFGDQMYLNDWPERFTGVHVLQHPGVGVAPWNQNDTTFTTDATEKLLVDGTPLIFYHFHALDILDPDVYAPAKLLH